MLFTSGGAPLDVAKGQKSPLRGWNSIAYGELSPSPSLRATQKGTELSWLTVIAPRADGVPASAVSASASVEPDGRVGRADLADRPRHRQPGRVRRRLPHRLRRRSPPPRCPAPTSCCRAAGRVVRATGLTPGESATLEQLPGRRRRLDARRRGRGDGGRHHRPAGRPDGDRGLPHRGRGRGLGAGARHRGVCRRSRPPASPPPRPVAARSPCRGCRPRTPAGRTSSSRSSRSPAARSTCAPDATSLEVTGVVPGQRAVKVRAVNPVARSPWATTSVAVPAYPSVSATGQGAQGHHGDGHAARPAAG